MDGGATREHTLIDIERGVMMFPRRVESRAEPDETTGRLPGQQRKILGAHHVLEWHNRVFAEHVRNRVGGERRHARIVDNRHVAGAHVQLVTAAERCRDGEAALQRVAQRLSHVLTEVANRAAERHTFGEHVFGEAALNGTDGNGAFFVRRDAARHTHLHGENRVRGENDGIGAFVWPPHV